MARILAVEDDPDILMLVRARLRGAGHQVMTATSGPETLALVEERGAPDVIVLDVGLPGMDGLELLTRLRQLPECATMPAVFLSARVQEEDVAAGIKLGATYLTKPFVASALIKAVERALPLPADTW